MNDKNLYDVTSLALFLQVHEQTIYSLLRTGAIKGIKVGNQWRITQSAVDEYLKVGE